MAKLQWHNQISVAVTAYNPEGQVIGTWNFAYDPSTLALTNETIVAGGVTNVLARSQDSFGRVSGFTLGDDYSVSYGYAGDGRFSGLTSMVNGLSSNSWTYSYLANSDLIAGVSNTVAGVISMRAYEPSRDLLTEIHNKSQSVTISKYQYSNDPIGRRTQRIDTTVSVTTNDFGYNTRSELTSAVMGSENFAWAFDNIGNRQTYTHPTGSGQATNLYTANELNQYTQISNETTEEPTCDADGNTLTYKGWTLAWTGENRLKSASNGSTVISFQYDYMGRRFSKVVEGVSTNLLHYDGWLLVQEQSTIAGCDGGNLTNVTHYVWGLDLSGSMQGAGGVGGLLGTYTDSSMYFACADGNGNVTDYTDVTGTNIVARYVYGAYGEILDSSGDKADDFNILFSSKYLDRETAVSGCPGIYYYGYRELWDARWVSRDLLWENGGMNLYGFCRNDPIAQLDPLGEEPVTVTVVIAGVTYKITVEAIVIGSACCCYLASPQGQQDMKSLSRGIISLGTEACDVVSQFATDAYEKAKQLLKKTPKAPPYADKPQPPEKGPYQPPEPDKMAKIIAAIMKLLEDWVSYCDK